MSETPNHASRAHALLSASSAARWLVCPPSAVAAAAYPRQESEYAQEGTQAHEVAEWMACYGDAEVEDPNITPEMIACAEGYRDYIQELKTTDDAVVLLEQRVDFSPWVPDGFGTCDCVILQGETMDIIDYKYGKGVAVSAERNPQMMLYALGALNDFGVAYDVQKIRMHIYQPRINNVSTYETTVADLIAWGDETVKPTAAIAAKGKGDYKPGEHCRFCPHAGKCRELTKVCTEYVGKMKVPCLAPWEIADVLQMEPTISIWLKRVKEQALTTMMEGGEIPGYKVVAGRGSRTWADEIEVARELEKQGISRDQYTETKILSVAQMEKALGGKKKFNDMIGGHVLSVAGSPTIAPATDKRPAYDRDADIKKAFEEE